MTSVLCAHRQQPSRGQHARRLWDPDDRDICRSPQLLSFIRGRWGVWAGESSCGPPSPPPLLPPARPAPTWALCVAPAEAQRLLWQSMESHRLSHRGLADGGPPFAALPLEAGVGGAAAAPALQPGPRRNTRHRNKRQRGEAAWCWRGWRWGRVRQPGAGRGGGSQPHLAADFLWDRTQVVVSEPPLSHPSSGRKGQVGWLLLEPCLVQQGPPGGRWDPGGEKSLPVPSPQLCSRIIRGSCIRCRCRLRP